jgi:TetR/AcrR family acrAB operon transcriptional repressor
MVRKVKGQAAMTRERLLDAAERVFVEHGVARTSLTEVAAAAGVTRGAVYWHFKDKADLLAAVCERAILPLHGIDHAALALAQHNPFAALRSLAVSALDRLASDLRTQAVFEVVFHKTERTGELAEIAGRQDRARRDCQSNIEAILEQAVRSGQMPAHTDTKLATRLLYGSVSGLMHDWVVDKGAYDLAAQAASLVDTMLAGLADKPPRLEKRVRPRVRPRTDMV